MKTNKCVAMVLAGGRGERLGALTQQHSKPVVYFGGNHRIIDFTLNNCRISGIGTVGILSQCFTADLNEYISCIYNGGTERNGISLLPSKDEDNLYIGTADAVYKNIEFVDQFMPENVLILSSDHIYRMDYNELINFHEEKNADVTVVSIPVSLEEASRFGILNAGEDGRVYDFEEKPRQPKSALASMGVYVFKWSALKKRLIKDNLNKRSKHDFGKDILPEMLTGSLFFTYQFKGYWRDVGTVDKLWEANMEQVNRFSILRMMDIECGIRDSSKNKSDSFFADNAVINQSILSDGCSVYGQVEHSVLGSNVTVGQGTQIINSVIMPNVYIGKNARISNTIVGDFSNVLNNAVIGENYGTSFFVDHTVCAGKVSLVAPGACIAEGMNIQKNSHISTLKLKNYFSLLGKWPEFRYEKSKSRTLSSV